LKGRLDKIRSREIFWYSPSGNPAAFSRKPPVLSVKKKGRPKAGGRDQRRDWATLRLFVTSERSLRKDQLLTLRLPDPDSKEAITDQKRAIVSINEITL